MAALAGAVQAAGLDNAPRVLAAAAARAANANAPASAPSHIIKAQAPPSEGEPLAEERLGPEGEPLTDNEQLRSSEYSNAYKELQAIDPGNPALGPFLQTPNWIPSEADVANIQAALAAAKSLPTRGLTPLGVVSPVDNPDQLQKAPASRLSEAAQGGMSLWDRNGGEWRYFPGDKWHNPHWDYNNHATPNSPWQNVPINNLSPRK